MKPSITAQDIQVAVAKLFNWRQNVIVPNVSWGIGLNHEADLVVVSKSGFLKEIEIKISASDIKADTRKGPRYARYNAKVDFSEVMGYNFHMEGPIRQLYFAVPEELADNPDIPAQSGLIKILHPPKYQKCYAKIVRPAKLNKQAVPLNDAQIRHLLHMGCMRIWSLKEKLAKQR